MNKITYGLEKVHIAYKGVAQAEAVQVTHGCDTDGEITVTITAAALGTASPLAVTVAVAAESHASAAQTASVAANTLNNNAVFSAAFMASVVSSTLYITARVVAANDPTLDITFTPGGTGVTAGASSAVAAGAVGWGAPLAIPGAVKFSPKTEGKAVKFYADNMLYYSATTNDGYTADLEAALVPDSMLAELLGWLIDDNGMLVEISDGVPKRFALMGQIEGDDKNRRFVYYDCEASRPSKEQKTKGESIEPATDVLNLTIFPLEINGRNMVRGVMELSDTNAAAYNAFFNAVYVPVIS